VAVKTVVHQQWYKNILKLECWLQQMIASDTFKSQTSKSKNVEGELGEWRALCQRSSPWKRSYKSSGRSEPSPWTQIKILVLGVCQLHSLTLT
jgi:hypothetical protein